MFVVLSIICLFLQASGSLFSDFEETMVTLENKIANSMLTLRSRNKKRGKQNNGVSQNGGSQNGGSHHVAPAGEMYLFTQSWAMEFCCGHKKKSECSKDLLPILGVHGLWPQFSANTWPQFCDASKALGSDYDFSSCEGKPWDPDFCHGGNTGFQCHNVLPPHIAPGYCGVDRKEKTWQYLANHEYPKHGACMALKPTDYYTEILNVLKRLPSFKHNEEELYGTPQYLYDNVGKCVTRETLERIFNKQLGVEDSVRLTCNRGCYLEEVSTCWKRIIAKDGSYRVGAPLSCNKIVGNKCNHCTNIKLHDGYKKGECSDITC